MNKKQWAFVIFGSLVWFAFTVVARHSNWIGDGKLMAMSVGVVIVLYIFASVFMRKRRDD
tara:strand:+ start:1622 stop:1801 length:180 start_codon:yes stop_codon:yes gene_type:complete